MDTAVAESQEKASDQADEGGGKSRRLAALMLKAARASRADKQSDKSSDPGKPSKPALSLSFVVGSMLRARKMSQNIQGMKQRREAVAELPREPTYRLEPRAVFSVPAVQRAVAEKLDARLGGFEYSPREASTLVRALSEEVKDRVKEFRYERYRVVTVVTLGEVKDQDVRVASRCEWFTQCDTVVDYTWRSPHMFCNVLVFGVYLD